MRKGKGKFVPTAQAAEVLGKSKYWLISRVKGGQFKNKQHYVNVSKGARPTYEFCVEEIQKLYYN